MKKISIIIPVFNSEKYLDTCLTSLVKQTHSNLEIILVDDGSTDKSGYLCDEWKNKDNRIRVIHQTNQGVSAARNHGLEYATGDFISFVDSDDTVEADMYELLIDMILRRGADIAHCGYKRIDEQGLILKEVSGSHIILEQNAADAVRCMLAGVYFVGGLWNKLYSYAIVKDLRFCVELKNNEDILFNILAFQNAKKIVFVDETKYCYYEHSSSACNQMEKERQVRDSALAAQIAVEQCKNAKVLEFVQGWNFDMKFNLYRFLVINQQTKTDEQRDLRTWLLQNHSIIKRDNLQEKVNHYLLFYCPNFYRIFYSIYDKLRKPNWDVQ